jgi:hypothetical protein
MQAGSFSQVRSAEYSFSDSARTHFSSQPIYAHHLRPNQSQITQTPNDTVPAMEQDLRYTYTYTLILSDLTTPCGTHSLTDDHNAIFTGIWIPSCNRLVLWVCIQAGITSIRVGCIRSLSCPSGFRCFRISPLRGGPMLLDR